MIWIKNNDDIGLDWSLSKMENAIIYSGEFEENIKLTPFHFTIKNNTVISIATEYQQLSLLRREKEELLDYLNSTDYITAKCFELGLSVEQTYPDEFVLRNQARSRINEIEADSENIISIIKGVQNE
jgi:hypothetical protein